MLPHTAMPQAAATPPLQIAALSKRYAQHMALHPLELEVRAGECLVLVGGNGAGKSTLLKCLCDLIRPAAGSVRIFGLPYAQARRRLAYLPERFLPPPHLSGWEFLRFMQALQGLVWHQDDAEALLRELDLAPEALRRPVGSLSKGMGQKLGLVAVLLMEKPLLLLDEPLSGLDPLARARVRALLTRYCRQGRSVLFSTHQFEGLENLADRILLLHEGRQRFLGEPAELLAHTGRASLDEAYLARIGA